MGDKGLTAGIYGRRDMDYSRQLIHAPTTEEEEAKWTYDGVCHVPKVDLYVRRNDTITVSSPLDCLLEMDSLLSRRTTSCCRLTVNPSWRTCILAHTSCSLSRTDTFSKT